jgi:hypothetical protein
MRGIISDIEMARGNLREAPHLHDLVPIRKKSIPNYVCAYVCSCIGAILKIDFLGRVV